MTLEESKEMLKEMKENATHYKKDITIQSVFEALEDTEKAVDIILNYIENESIPKEKVEKKIEQLTENDNLVINEKWDSVDVVCAKREEMAQVDILQELLGE